MAVTERWKRSLEDGPRHWYTLGRGSGGGNSEMCTGERSSNDDLKVEIEMGGSRKRGGKNREDFIEVLS